MIYIECPEEYEFQDFWNPDIMDYIPTVFLAGSISNCWDWQEQLTKFLSEDDIVVINPRRKNFDLADSRAQITWEYKYLQNVDIISFWFSQETLNPIVLFELGAALHNLHAEVVVGCHPDYKRREDVIIQCELANPTIKVVNNLVDLSRQISEKATYFV